MGRQLPPAWCCAIHIPLWRLQRLACPGMGCSGARPWSAASSPDSFPHRPCKEGNGTKFPRTPCPVCLAVGKGETPGATAWNWLSPRLWLEPAGHFQPEPQPASTRAVGSCSSPASTRSRLSWGLLGKAGLGQHSPILATSPILSQWPWHLPRVCFRSCPLPVGHRGVKPALL